MQKLKYVVGFLIIAVAGLAWAVAEQQPDRTASQRALHIIRGLYVGPLSSDPTRDTANKITRSLGASSTINFASSVVTPVDSSGITVTGAQAGDPCFVGVPTAAGALNAEFTCYVSAADTAKVKFIPHDQKAGDFFLDGGAQAVTVSAGSMCLCNDEDDETKSCKMPVSSTTATITGTAGTSSITLRAPVIH